METCKKYVELHDRIKNIKTAMLTTMHENGCLRSMPMTTMQTECEGNVWFFTNLASLKVDEIEKHRCVNVSYSDVDNETYVSISGKAEVVRDRTKMEELWKPVLKAYFPNGINDPNLALLKVQIEEAEYWDSSSNKMVQLWDLAKTYVTHDPENMGNHSKMKF
ncbi:MAG TPA: pyridoxamine 5'-phosphate oxidase family protein [Cytophagaceae bacterium]